MARWEPVGLEGSSGGAKLMEQLLLPRDGFSGRVCTVAEIIDESSEVGGRYRGSQGGGTGRSSGVSRPRNQRPRFCCSGGRRRLAAVCCQAVVIYGSLLGWRGALTREKPTSAGWIFVFSSGVSVSSRL